MTEIKWNFSSIGAESDPLIAIMGDVNTSVNGFMMYSILILLYVVSFYVIQRRINDVAKAGLMSMHIIMIVSLVMFYGGGLIGIILIPEILMLGIVVLEALAIAGLFYMRSSE